MNTNMTAVRQSPYLTRENRTKPKSTYADVDLNKFARLYKTHTLKQLSKEFNLSLSMTKWLAYNKLELPRKSETPIMSNDIINVQRFEKNLGEFTTLEDMINLFNTSLYKLQKFMKLRYGTRNFLEVKEILGVR